MERSLRRQIQVGIFSFIGLVLFCVSIVLLGGDRFFLKDTYKLKVLLPQVQGLGRGSVVSLSGIQVGNVVNIRFLPNTPEVEVTLDITESVRHRITKGSIASLRTQGALGDKYVYIEPGPMDAPALNNGEFIETDRSPDLLDVIASKGAQLGEIVTVIQEVRKLFENINRDGMSRQLMTNLVEGTANFNKVMIETKEVMAKLNSGHGTLGALINDPTLHKRLSSLVGDSPRNRFLKPLIRDSIQTSEQTRKP